MMKCVRTLLHDVVCLERHRLGPRLHLFGRRVHEYQAGLAILAVSPVVAGGGSVRLAALAGLWLVAKDWPDLFPATRDRASWRLGIHRLPSATYSNRAASAVTISL